MGNVYKIILKIFLPILVGFTIQNCTKRPPLQTSAELSQNPYYARNLRVDKNGLSKISAVLVTVYGAIEIKFYPKEAPLSVSRFLELVSIGFYNGLTFHRVIPNFIIQTGDPTGLGSGGSGTNLVAEFNQVPHIKGTVALARGKDPDSGDSQFYIALTSLPHLDGKNTVIGQVVSGIEILNKIKVGDEVISFTIRKK